MNWQEPACLVRARRAADDETVREIVVEGSFAEVAAAFSRFRTDQWGELTIAFTERRVPPFRYEAGDFERHVLSRLLGLNGR